MSVRGMRGRIVEFQGSLEIDSDRTRVTAQIPDSDRAECEIDSRPAKPRVGTAACVGMDGFPSSAVAKPRSAPRERKG